jgi:hypothetical protein
VINTLEQRLKRWRGVRSLSRSHRAREAGFIAFEKIKCIFSIASEENFGEVVGVIREIKFARFLISFTRSWMRRNSYVQFCREMELRKEPSIITPKRTRFRKQHRGRMKGKFNALQVLEPH